MGGFFLLLVTFLIGLVFSQPLYKVNRLIILTENLTPDLFQAININEFYLSQKGYICKAYTVGDIENCLNTFEAKEIWYVYLGHSKGFKLGNFLNLSNLKFSKPVDYIILDGCYLGKNKVLLYNLLKFTKKGIFASNKEIPYLGMLPLYKEKWKNPMKALKMLKDFYKDNPLSEYFFYLSKNGTIHY
jgi:hypothetical protein